jgi:hypothetical protein
MSFLTTEADRFISASSNASSRLGVTLLSRVAGRSMPLLTQEILAAPE